MQYQIHTSIAIILTVILMVMWMHRQKKSYAGIYTGAINKPNPKSCKIMRERALLEYGILVNDNDDFGGAYLSGYFQLLVDENNNIEQGISFVEIQGVKLPFIGGRVANDGSFFLLADGTLPFEGLISNGNVSGTATGMEGQSWVWGDIVGRII